MTNHLRKRFIKDFQLPIPVWSEESLFNYYIDRLDKYHNSKYWYSLLRKIITKFGNPEDFLSYHKSLSEKIINHVKSKPEYQKFISDKLDNLTPKHPIQSRNLYTLENHNRDFISIDIIKANFFSLYWYDHNLTDNHSKFEDWLKQFFEDYDLYQYFSQSKYFRQVIFGNLNPKRQEKIQRFIIDKLIDFLLENNIILEDQIYTTNKDELILYDNGRKINIHNFEFFNNLRVKYFRLKSIGGKSFFVKEYRNGKIEFKSIPIHYFHQVLRKYEGTNLQAPDLTFTFEDKIAMFKESVFD